MMFCAGRQETQDSDDFHNEISMTSSPAKDSRNKSEDLYKRRQSRVHSLFGIDFEEMRRMREERRHSENIDHRIRKLHKHEKKIQKLLLLGTGESGKSTFAKQMKIIHIDKGYTEDDRKKLIAQIRNNIRDSIVSLCEALESLEIALSDPSLKDMVQYICTEATKPEFAFPQVFYDYVSALWQDEGLQSCYQRSGEFQLLDSTKYLFEHLATMRQSDYLPTDQDVLRTRQKTTNINLLEFTVKEAHKPVNFHLYDVGGQKGERRKWIQVFQDVNAIVFLVDVSCFDLTMTEEGNKNKLVESMEVFEQVWNNKYLRNVSVLLFLNKIDRLEEKIAQNRKFESFVERVDPNTPYYDFIKTWNTSWPGPEDKDVQEFIASYPGNDVKSPRRKFSGREKRPSVLQDMDRVDLQQDTIRTAIFIKQLFRHIISNPLPVGGVRRTDRGSHWHQKHCLRTYYTCAVDTHTVKKVFESAKTFMLFQTVSEW